MILCAKQKPLLPNLKVIVYSLDLISHADWLTLFLSPTLLSIKQESPLDAPVLTVERSSALLKCIEVCCPALEELSLHPMLQSGLSDSFGRREAFSSIYEGYLSLHNLRFLSTTINFFDHSTLLALGRLPQLDTLEVSQACFISTSVPTIALPDDSFPALRNLILLRRHRDEISLIWAIPQLVAKLSLVSARVVGIEDETNAYLIFSKICEYSPRILDLKLHLNGAALESFGYFSSLRKLSLERLHVDVVSYPLLEDLCEILDDVCPLLRELRVPATYTSISDLQHVSRLSRLEYLSADVNWSSCEDLPEATPEPSSLSRVFQRLDGTDLFYKKISFALAQRTILYVLFFPCVSTSNSSLRIVFYSAFGPSSTQLAW